MRLLSITVRNYRILQQVRVDLDPRLTLIGAPNESGKSTLIEAAQRALFLRSKVTGAAQEDMQSQIHIGHPEVEVEFEAGGGIYHLAKRFSGTSGTTKLTQTGGATLQGDEAEERLNQLLGNIVTGKRLSLDKVREQWSHLWIWQGSSGTDPTEAAMPQQDALLQRLQAEGGSVVMQSALDARVAAEIASRNSNTFTQRSNQVKAGSDLSNAEKAARETEAAAQEAASSLAQLRQAMEQHHSATDALKLCDQAAPILKTELEQTEAQLEQVKELRLVEKQQQSECAALTKELQSLQDISANAARLTRDLERVQHSLSPLQESTGRLQAAISEGRTRVSVIAERVRKAGEATRAARLQDELAAAWGRQHDLSERHRLLGARAAEASALKESLAMIEKEFAQLPKVDKLTWSALQKLDNAASLADSAWRAIAAGIEVVASDQSVQVADSNLTAGQQCLITDETEIHIGPGIHLRIRPGGGTSLTEARFRAETALQNLTAQLDALGLDNLRQAQDIHGQRQHLETQIQSLRAELKGMNADRLNTELHALSQDLAAADAEVQRRQPQLPGFARPADAAATAALQRKTRAALGEFECAEQTLRRDAEQAGHFLSETESHFEKERAQAAAQTMRLVELETAIKLLAHSHGDEAARGGKMESMHAALATAAAQLAATQKALSSLQPDLLEQDRQRLQRSLEQNSLDRQKAGESQAAAAALLNQAGDTDPQATVVVTQARALAAQEHLARVRRRALATLRLHELFQEEQRALADHFTRPLSEKAAGYLRCLFGADAQVRLTLSAQSFTGLEVIRPGQASGAFPFEKLSGGTREQVAAAVRLAMAEVLAASHDGCLPVVFDDAFAYSDPERVRVLQRMLNLAASRGLQIIVASCNPADYASLGAATVRLGPLPT